MFPENKFSAYAKLAPGARNSFKWIHMNFMKQGEMRQMFAGMFLAPATTRLINWLRMLVFAEAQVFANEPLTTGNTTPTLTEEAPWRL